MGLAVFVFFGSWQPFWGSLFFFFFCLLRALGGGGRHLCLIRRLLGGGSRFLGHCLLGFLSCGGFFGGLLFGFGRGFLGRLLAFNLLPVQLERARCTSPFGLHQGGVFFVTRFLTAILMQ